MDGIKNRKIIFQDFKKVTFEIEGWVRFYLVGEGGRAWKKRPEEHEKAESEEFRRYQESKNGWHFQPTVRHV